MGTTTPEAVIVDQLSFKVAATDVEAPGKVEVRADEGIVEAIVSVTGIEDSVQDIIEPGAYKDTLTKRKPKVIWHHSWEQPIGRILHIEELLPGDPRLPQQTKDGRGWPSKAGGLLATMQFNLKSDRGREAFEAVRFYSESGECEWSIGYQVPSSAATRDKKGVRHIKSIDLYEISFVLFGAASDTGTLGLKAAYEHAMEQKRKFTADERQKMADKNQAMDDGSYPIANEADLRNAIQAYGRANNKSAVKAHIVKRAKALGLTRLLPDGWDTSGKDAAVDTEPDVEQDLFTDPDEGDDDELTALVDGFTDEDIAGLEADTVDLDEADIALIDSFTAEEKAITPGGRVGDASPVGKPGGRQNWVDKAGGLPRYIRMVAHALLRRGMSESRAISTAVATMKRWAAGAGHVSAKVQAAAAKALAEWEAMRARAHITKDADVELDTKAYEWTPDLEWGRYAATKTVSPSSYRDYPKIEGTFEERIEAVRSAVIEALMEPVPDAESNEGPESKTNQHVCIDGTWPDRVIATVVSYGDGTDDRESYEMNYTLNDDGSVTLSEPQPVQLTVYVEPTADGEPDGENPMGDMLGIPDMVEAALNTARGLSSFEAKAGRVLSGVNENRLKGALESLIAVLRQAGINIDMGGPMEVKPPEVDPESTAPSTKGIPLDPRDVQVQLAALGLTD